VKIIVTRHKVLLDYLVEIGLAEGDEEVVSHAAAQDVEGKDVIGILPLYLAAKAKSVTAVPVIVPEELRGRELTLEQVRQFAGRPTTYLVMEVDGP
jgi:putative CRISPR-associated protein (TIGR02620 family)